jgi:hypothetical protein
MSARKRASKINNHAMTMKGMYNNASGQWVRDTNVRYTSAYITHYNESQQKRLERGSSHKALKASAKWAEARILAKEALEKRGDLSDPLDGYISTFYHRLKRK